MPREVCVDFCRQALYPPSQKTMGVSPWMNAQGEPAEARRAKAGASADSAEEMKDITGVSPGRLHEINGPRANLLRS